MKKLILVLSVLALFVFVVGCVPTEPQTQEEFEAQVESGAIAGQAVASEIAGSATCRDYLDRKCTPISGGASYTTSTGTTVRNFDTCSIVNPGVLVQYTCTPTGAFRRCSTTCANGCANAQCTAPAPPVANFCGDGVVAGGERCDDRNVVNGDGCSATCIREPSCINRFVAPRDPALGIFASDAAVNVTGTFNCPGNTQYNMSNGKYSHSGSWCRTDNTTYSGCVPVATHLSQCAAANTCRN